jgi:hypothetical protein
MPKPIPKLDLSHGQVAWALSLGKPPEQKLLDQMRYLRQLGIPFTRSELGMGRGNRVRYDFDHLTEVGVGVAALRRGMTPKEIAGLLVKNRKELRAIYREAYLSQPNGALEADWIKSRGKVVPLLEKERFLRLHDRYSDSPGKIERIRQEEVSDPLQLFSMVERYPGEKLRTLFPLTRLTLELVAWALEAPETRTGPQ